MSLPVRQDTTLAPSNGAALAIPPIRVETASIDLMTLCGALAKSGYFKDVRDASQAVVKVLYGQELGVTPVTSMMGIHIIEGKPAPSANLLAAIVKRSQTYKYRILRHEDTVCEIEFSERGQVLGVSKWTKADAERAELWGKPNWKKYPRQMLFSRALSEGVRIYCPELFGGAPVYTPDELGANVNADGDVIDTPGRAVNATTGEVIDVSDRVVAAMETQQSFAGGAIQKPVLDIRALKAQCADHLKALGWADPKRPHEACSDILGAKVEKLSDLTVDQWAELDRRLAATVIASKRAFAAYADWCQLEGHDSRDRSERLTMWADVAGLPSLDSAGRLLPSEWLQVADFFTAALEQSRNAQTAAREAASADASAAVPNDPFQDE